jgi:hypothetical protein
MAANTTLAGRATLPACVSVTGVGTTWQEFTLNAANKSESVSVVGDVALYVAFSADGAADSGAVAAGARIPVSAAAALAGVEFALNADATRRATSIFVAAQSGTAAVTVEQE